MTITIDRAVLEKALENVCGARLCSINSMSSRSEQHRLMGKAITVLRKALNAPQPEPRREWEPLSLDQISMAWDRAYRQPLSQAALNFARDLENTLKERNHE